MHIYLQSSVLSVHALLAKERCVEKYLFKCAFCQPIQFPPVESSFVIIIILAASNKSERTPTWLNC